MRKILQSSLRLILLLAAVLALSPAALAAPNLISLPGTAAKYQTSISGATVVITNNYGSSDSVEITLPAPAAANVVYWAYMPGSTDKSALLGTITIKKGASVGRTGVSAAKFGDFSSGSVDIVTGTGTATSKETCEYGPAGATGSLDTSKVTLRNCPTGAELLIVDASIVKKGMTAIAIVNGKLYKATASKDGVALQVPLASNMEVDTPVWYTLAAAGCQDIGYSSLQMKGVETTVISGITMKLFFQGDGNTASSLLLVGVNPGDTVRCTTADGSVKKSATVPANTNMVTVSGMKLSENSQLLVTITEKGKLESTPTNITVPTNAVPPTLKATAVSVTNTQIDYATIKVKNVTLGDTVNVYNAQGALVDSGLASYTPSGDPDEEVPTTAEVLIDNLDLGTVATSVYLSVSSPGKGESAWLKVTVPAAK